jgi:hypothetical protein
MQYIMRKRIRIILKTVSFMILFLMVCHGAVPACLLEIVKVRSVKVRIIDKSTGSPLEGIPVYYSLRTHWPRMLLFIFKNPAGNETRENKALEAYVSDAHGEVTIPSRKVILRGWKRERLCDEEIYINIDNPEYGNMEDKIDSLGSVVVYGKQRFANPVPLYRGFYICSTTWEMDPNARGGTKFEITDALWNSNGLNKKETETFVVELERW